jgi:hypothetical protein
MIDLEALDVRNLQKESSLAVVSLGGDNHTLSKFNKLAHHNSQSWYKAVINHYIEIYGDLPSKAGPAKDIKLLF